jgi:hypothetical protein
VREGVLIPELWGIEPRTKKSEKIHRTENDNERSRRPLLSNCGTSQTLGYYCGVCWGILDPGLEGAMERLSPFDHLAYASQCGVQNFKRREKCFKCGVPKSGKTYQPQDMGWGEG